RMCIYLHYPRSCFFFFQAEDGIRDLIVTGVQTCALPISQHRRLQLEGDKRQRYAMLRDNLAQQGARSFIGKEPVGREGRHERGEIGRASCRKECRRRWWAEDEKKKKKKSKRRVNVQRERA